MSLTVYNTAGQVVRRLVREYQIRGFYQVAWDGRNESGGQVSSGVYIYRLVNQGFVRQHVETRRMLFVK